MIDIFVEHLAHITGHSESWLMSGTTGMLSILNQARGQLSRASSRSSHALRASERVSYDRLRAEVELAQRVQRCLLPQRPPKIAGLDMYACSRPALSVGGDFYDFIALPERPFLFSIGDVVGKGLSAALLMTMTRAAIRSKASFLPHPTPEAVMRQSHKDLYDDFAQVGSFATAMIGQYDPQRRELVYANAGHAPVIYRPAGERAQLLLADSTAIGILPASGSRNQSIAMAPGDLLIAATDGFHEAHCTDDEQFGVERLIDLVDTCPDLPAEQVAARLFSTIEYFRNGRPQDDDQTLVVIRGVAA